MPPTGKVHPPQQAPPPMPPIGKVHPPQPQARPPQQPPPFKPPFLGAPIREVEYYEEETIQ